MFELLPMQITSFQLHDLANSLLCTETLPTDPLPFHGSRIRLSMVIYATFLWLNSALLSLV